MNLHTFNTSIRSTIKGSILLILNSFVFITAAIFSFIIPNKSLCIAFGLSSIIEALFFLQNRKSIKAWDWYLYYTLSISIITILSYPYIQEYYIFSGFWFIFLCQSFLLLIMSMNLRHHNSTDWIRPARSSGLAILFSVMLLAHSVFDFIPISFTISGIFILLALSYILIVSEFKKLNKHYNSVKILRRNIKVNL